MPFVFSSPATLASPQQDPDAHEHAAHEIAVEPKPTAASHHTAQDMQLLKDDLCSYWKQLEPLSEPETEKAMCATMLRCDDEALIALKIASQNLNADDFVVPEYRRIAQLCLFLLAQDLLPSFVAINALAAQRKVDIGGIHTLTDLANDPTARYFTPKMFEQSAQQVASAALKRVYRELLSAQLAQIDRIELSSALDSMRDGIHSVANQLQNSRHAPVHIWQALEPVLDQAVNPDQSAGFMVKTGFTSLDEKLGGGLRGGDYVLIGARPSMGKTALALNLGRNTSCFGGATGKPIPTLVFSLEMTNQALAARALSSESRIGLNDLRKGQLTDEQLHTLLDVVHRFRNPEDSPDVPGFGANLWLIDQGGMTLQDIRTVSRNFVRTHGRCLILIDYIQLIGLANAQRGMDKHSMLGAVSAGLKEMAKELDSPVIALSQLNRALEQRACKRPVLSDLRESGNLEQDADVILFLYRDSVYHPDTAQPDEAELIIAKQRDGAIGVLPMRYRGDIVKFDMGAAIHE